MDTHVREDIAARFGESTVFRLAMLLGTITNLLYSYLVIVLNSIIVGIQTDETIVKSSTNLFLIIDQLFLTIFILEILYKWYFGFFSFWKSGWNWFDVIIVSAGPGVQFLSNSRTLRVLRVMRTLRSLRSVNMFKGLQLVVQTILTSLPV